MTYDEETYVLDTLKEIQETIRSPEFKQFIFMNIVMAIIILLVYTFLIEVLVSIII